MLSQENTLYPFLSLAAEIGGYVGLLLGIAFFDLVKFAMVQERDSQNYLLYHFLLVIFFTNLAFTCLKLLQKCRAL
jgi:hypothetical protein